MTDLYGPPPRLTKQEKTLLAIAVGFYLGDANRAGSIIDFEHWNVILRKLAADE